MVINHIEAKDVCERGQVVEPTEVPKAIGLQS